MQLARNKACDNSEQEELFPGPKEGEMVPGQQVLRLSRCTKGQ